MICGLDFHLAETNPQQVSAGRRSGLLIKARIAAGHRKMSELNQKKENNGSKALRLLMISLKLK